MSKWKDMAEQKTILRCLVGSQAYGLNGESSDRDEKGVCVESIDASLTLRGEFEQYEFRTAAERTGVKDAKSEPGDLDLTIYGLKKFLRLAAYGNPNVVELLFIKGDCRLECDERGQALQDMAYCIVSRDAGRRYLGYMEAQRQRLLGERGQMKVKRTDLIEAHGYDTKYACHLLRLGYQGVELQETGKLVLPIQGPVQEFLIAVRNGRIGLDEILNEAGVLETKLKDLIKDGPLRSEPDYEVIEGWMQDVYLGDWNDY